MDSPEKTMMINFTLQGGDNSLANTSNWSGNVEPGPSDTAVIDSAGLVPSGQALGLFGALSAGEADLDDLIELDNVSTAATNEFSVARSTHFFAGGITVNAGAAGNFDLGGTHGGGEFLQAGGAVN